VIGHSLGSVVAYNVLRTDPRSLQIPLFVTAGSPLAIRAVRDEFRPLRSPSAVAAWYNAVDTRDVVALYPLDADNFPVQLAIQNDNKVKNSTDNHHGRSEHGTDDPGVESSILPCPPFLLPHQTLRPRAGRGVSSLRVPREPWDGL
jgi:hypothetical protein